MKYCSNCGAGLSDNMHFCPKCGKLQQESEAGNPAYDEWFREAHNIPKIQKRKKKIPVGLFLLLAVVIISIVGIAFYRFANTEKSGAVSDTTTLDKTQSPTVSTTIIDDPSANQTTSNLSTNEQQGFQAENNGGSSKFQELLGEAYKTTGGKGAIFRVDEEGNVTYEMWQPNPQQSLQTEDDVTDKSANTGSGASTASDILEKYGVNDTEIIKPTVGTGKSLEQVLEENETAKVEKEKQQRKSLLEELVDMYGTDGLNEEYINYALNNGGGFGATSGGLLVDENGNYELAYDYTLDKTYDVSYVLSHGTELVGREIYVEGYISSIDYGARNGTDILDGNIYLVSSPSSVLGYVFQEGADWDYSNGNRQAQETMRSFSLECLAIYSINRNEVRAFSPGAYVKVHCQVACNELSNMIGALYKGISATEP